MLKKTQIDHRVNVLHRVLVRHPLTDDYEFFSTVQFAGKYIFGKLQEQHTVKNDTTILL